jgi:hypothetical protein
MTDHGMLICSRMGNASAVERRLVVGSVGAVEGPPAQGPNFPECSTSSAHRLRASPTTSLGRERIAPRKLGAVKPAARRELPLRFRRQFLIGPFRVSLGLTIGDVHDRMAVEPTDRAAWAVETAPVGAELEIPPMAPVGRVDRVLGWRENERGSLEHLRQSTGIVLRVGRISAKVTWR